MEKEVRINGWVIYTPKHNFCGSELWFDWSFREKRKDCINDFIADTEVSWVSWKRTANFKCVKAERIVKIKI
jgi:hypothetical protein